MPTANVRAGTIHFRDSGAGNDVVLLLHAFPLHSGMWAPQLASLAARHRVIAPDHRGMGESRPAPDSTTVDAIADDVEALLRRLGIRRAAVAGLSMGGYVAFALYRRAPALFRGLALCATKATPDTEEARATRLAFATDALAKGIDWVAEMTPKLLRPSADPAVFSTVREIIRGNTPEGVAAAQRAMAQRPDSVPTLSRITCPTLVVAGEEDQLMPFAEAQRMARTVRGARMVRIPAAGHLANLDNPSAFNTALSAFLSRLPA